MNKILIVAFYKFFPFEDFRQWQEPLMSLCSEQKIRGTLLLAEEGISGNLAGAEEAVEKVLFFLQNDARLKELDVKRAWHEDRPFKRIKVLLKKEIITLKQPEVNSNEQVGVYVQPEQWNDLISEPDVLVLDTRNDYEIEHGKFKNAEDLNLKEFTEFTNYMNELPEDTKEKKVAMYCTGGIRCEKASSLMLQAGFKEVYHLKGGILDYLQKVPKKQSLWEGECFVFDERVSVGHGEKY